MVTTSLRDWLIVAAGVVAVVGAFLGLVVRGGQAAEFTSGGFTTSASLSPSTATTGSPVTITASVTSAASTTGLVDVEVYTLDGKKLYQQFWDHQSFAAGQRREYTLSWTPTGGAAAAAGTGSATLTFDDRSGSGKLNGQYPAGLIDWGNGGWYHSDPWRLFTTKSISFRSGSQRSGSFTFMTPRRLASLQAVNGGSSASTVTVACSGQPTKTVVIGAGQLADIVTGWTGACTTVTFTSSNGWDTNFDNLVHEGTGTAGSTQFSIKVGVFGASWTGGVRHWNTDAALLTVGSGSGGTSTPPPVVSGTSTTTPIVPASPTASPTATASLTSTPSPLPAGSFLETFEGNPATPTAYMSNSWDILVHSRDRITWDRLETMVQMHGPDCGAPPASHVSNGRYEDAVFSCRNHLMTAVKAGGYGLVYLTPSVLASWAGGEAVIRWDVSTHQTSGGGREWFDLWLTPWDEHLIHPLDEGLPDLQGPPRNALQIKMFGNNGDVSLCPTLYRNHHSVPLASCSDRGWDSVLTPSQTVRSTIEVRVSRTHLKVWMPQYNLVWFDADIPALTFTQAVPQFGHHSYNPEKAGGQYCEDGPPPCRGNTFHWDNISISPSVPFTLIKSDRRYVDKDTTNQVNFAAPAPANAHLRFSGIGGNLQVSFDGGRTWHGATQQPESVEGGRDFESYWTAIPAGTQSVQFRGQYLNGFNWRAKDISIFAR